MRKRKGTARKRSRLLWRWSPPDDELAVLERSYRGGDFLALIDAVRLLGKRDKIPPGLAHDLIEELVKHVGKRGLMRWVERRRWRYVRKAFERTFPNGDRLKYEEVFDYVSDQLKDTPAAGAPETIRKSYEKVEGRLPQRERRELTYKRRALR